MNSFGIKFRVADNGKIPPFFSFLFLILTGIMVNRCYKIKKEVKFGAKMGTVHPFLIISFSSFLSVLR